MSDQIIKTAPKPTVQIPALLALIALILVLTLAARLWWIEAIFPAINPKGPTIAPFALIFAPGLALILTLAHANRHRWSTVLRPSLGRMICAVVLALVTPFAVYGWVPWPFGFMMVYGAFLLAEGGPPDLLLKALAYIAVATGLWYPVASLIITGLRSRLVRVVVLGMMFWTAYSAIILIRGTQIIQL